MSTHARPQDRLVLREGAAHPRTGPIEPRSVLGWTLLSLPLVGYFVWYHHAQRDSSLLLEDGSDPWFWMAMLFPGMLLVVPYAAAQARVVARVELATRRPFGTVAYVGLCVGGFLVPALLTLVLQRRLNQVTP